MHLAGPEQRAFLLVSRDKRPAVRPADMPGFLCVERPALMLSTRSIVSALLLIGAQLLAAANVQAGTLEGRVVGVIDGDTITLLDSSNRQYKIRFAGIDAPEKNQPYGQKAKEHLSDLVFDRQVIVETEKEDRYRRPVGKVLIEGRDTNLAMVVAGYAWHYKKYQAEQSPDDRLLYDSAEREARTERRGLWADPNPMPPSEWRAGKTSRAAPSAKQPN